METEFRSQLHWSDVVVLKTSHPVQTFHRIFLVIDSRFQQFFVVCFFSRSLTIYRLSVLKHLLSNRVTIYNGKRTTISWNFLNIRKTFLLTLQCWSHLQQSKVARDISVTACCCMLGKIKECCAVGDNEKLFARTSLNIYATHHKMVLRKRAEASRPNNKCLMNRMTMPLKGMETVHQ